ncbi:MAG: hypothetical protein PSX71_13985 [bacterium]|nr:hypothetical protein [bacterium]
MHKQPSGVEAVVKSGVSTKATVAVLQSETLKGKAGAGVIASAGNVNNPVNPAGVILNTNPHFLSVLPAIAKGHFKPIFDGGIKGWGFICRHLKLGVVHRFFSLKWKLICLHVVVFAVHQLGSRAGYYACKYALKGAREKAWAECWEKRQGGAA